MPEVVFKGRFWAEEGRNFFQNALVVSPLQALLTPYGGYLNLVANAATLAARMVMPLRLAPYLTIVVGLAFQLLPPLLLLTCRDRWLSRLRNRVAALLLLLLVPASEEIWLQTLHCQFELTLCCGIILALETTAGLAAFGRLAILLLTPLCGPGAIVLVPLFLARAVLDRSGARVVQGLTLAAGSAIQLVLFIQPFVGRTYGLNPIIMLWVITIRHLVVPFFGLSAAGAATADVHSQLATGHFPIWATLLPVLVFTLLVAVMLRQPRSAPALWLLAAADLTASAAYFGAIGGVGSLIDVHSGERYIFVPQALLSLAVLALAATASRRVAAPCWGAVIWLITVGAVSFESTLPQISNGPSWRAEVKAWQHDPSHAIRLWPNGWTVRLPREQQ